MTAVRSAIAQQIQQHPQIRSGREQSCMSRYSAVRVPGIAVVRFAVQHILPPTVPCSRVTAISISERRVVHHVLLITIPLFRCSEIGKTVLLREKRYRFESEWSIQFLLDEYIQWLSTHVLDDVAEQHEAEIAVVPAFANAPLQRHLPDHVVRLALVERVVVQRLPLDQPRRVCEQVPNRDTV